MVDDPTNRVVNDYIPLNPKIADIPSAIHGTPELTAALLALCLEYADIFSRSVRDTPALVPELQMKLDRQL
jgi:hypothetical protein